MSHVPYIVVDFRIELTLNVSNWLFTV